MKINLVYTQKLSNYPARFGNIVKMSKIQMILMCRQLMNTHNITKIDTNKKATEAMYEKALIMVNDEISVPKQVCW